MVSAGMLTLGSLLLASSVVSVQSGASLTMTPGSGAVLKTASMVNYGTLDVGDNKLILPGASLLAVTDQIRIGRNGGAWNGAGIITSMPAAKTTLTTLAVARAGDI